MYFDENFIQSLPEDPNLALRQICDKYTELMRGREDNSEIAHDISIQGLGLVAVYLEAIGGERSIPELKGPSRRHDVEKVRGFIRILRDEASRQVGKGQYADYRHLFAKKFEGVFRYEFSEGDLKKIQELLDQLRNLISESEELGEGHRHRLLKRLEKLQSELHKTVSDLDRFWGFFIDASIVVGLMGENAKPMVDVIKQIVSIVWPTQTRAYELPSDLPFKLLGQAEDEKSE